MNNTDTTRVEEPLVQLPLFDKKQMNGLKTSFADPSFSTNKNLPVHRWVPWIAGFSSEFVRDVIEDELSEKGVVLDPFAGVGTTLVEAALLGHDVIGFEINPYAALACYVKLEATHLNLNELLRESDQMVEFCRIAEKKARTPISKPPEGFSTRLDFYSPSVLKKVLTLQDFILGITNDLVRRLFQTAFAATMVSYSNYSYEPSLGTRKAAGRENIEDADVASVVATKIREMAEDVKWLKQTTAARVTDRIIEGSFFEAPDLIEPSVADLVITSPPYLNNYHYIRNTRPHLYWLGFYSRPGDLKKLEQANFGKYWQTVRDGKPVELTFSGAPDKLMEQLGILRSLNLEKGVYGGAGWANYAASYFNDCYRFALGLLHALKPGGRAYVVIGNSILQGLMIPTDIYLGEIARIAGLELSGIFIPRGERVGNSIIQSDVRVGKAENGRKLYEAVVVLRKPA